MASQISFISVSNSCSLVSPHGVLSVLPPKVSVPGLSMKSMVGKRDIPKPSVVITACAPENGSCIGAPEYWGKPAQETELVGESDLLESATTGCNKSSDQSVATRSFKLKTICIFWGSSYGRDIKKLYRDVAKELSSELVKRGINLVYGGLVSTKAMGRGAETVTPAGKNVISVPKAEMVRRADAFVVLPGGVGSLDEILDMTTSAQLGVHNKPVGLLNVDGSYDTVNRWLDKARQYGRLEQVTGCVVSATTGAELLHKLLEYTQQCSENQGLYMKSNT